MDAHRVSAAIEIDEKRKEDKTMTGKALATQDDSNNLPAHMRSENPKGGDELRHYRDEQFIKIIQKAGSLELVDRFGVGSAILSPDEFLLASAGETFQATVIALWVTGQKHRDFNDKSSQNFVIEEVYNPAHEIFKRAKSWETRVEQYGNRGEFKYNYLRVFNLALLIRGGEADGERCRMEYIKRGEKIGSRLASYLERRWKQGHDIYGNTFKFRTEEVQSKNSTSYVLEFDPIRDWTDTEETYRELERMHDEVMDVVSMKRRAEKSSNDGVSQGQLNEDASSEDDIPF